MRGVGGLRVEYDSDEFADDEAMSNAEEDSSSQEYLDDEPADYLHEEYARRFHAPGSQAWNYTSAGKTYIFLVGILGGKLVKKREEKKSIVKIIEVKRKYIK
jgi:hypothetical protein